MESKSQSEVTQIQLEHSLNLLLRTGAPQQKGVKALLKDLAGTFNHKFEKYYKRKKYATLITKHYKSNSNLKSSSLSKTDYSELINLISVSDKENFNSRTPLVIYLERLSLGVVYRIYKFVFVILKSVYKTLRKLKNNQ